MHPFNLDVCPFPPFAIQRMKQLIYLDIYYAGGWTLVANLKSDGELIEMMDIIKKSPTMLGNNTTQNYALNYQGVKILKDEINATQFRVYCRKENVNRTVHVMTKDNRKGRKVFNYFVGIPTTNSSADLPAACGSYDILNGDNSQLAANCSQWNWKTGTWGYGNYWQEETRIYAYTMFIANKYHVLVIGKEKVHLCDDVEYNGDKHSYAGVWQYFIR